MQNNNASEAITQLDFQHLSTRYDRNTSALWVFLHPHPRPCVTPELLADLDTFHQILSQYDFEDSSYPIQYLVFASKIDGIFNLGGDLGLFMKLIENKDKDGLFNYAEQCVTFLSRNINSYSSSLTTIALIQGSALGGGFEAALSFNHIVAERNAQMGLPEILFNMFPGMGAYSFLSRRLSPARAEEFITSGKTYSAEELYDMDIVDILAEDGEGKSQVDKLIKKLGKNRNARIGIQKVRNRVVPVSHEELLDVTKIWVETALQLKPRDISIMKRLVSAQNNFDQTYSTQVEQLYKRRSGYEWRQADIQRFPIIDHMGNTIRFERRKNDDRRNPSR